jgi:2-deoxy-D-gluconate 3-dehydrogenase
MLDKFDLSGKFAVVTGGAGGLGYAIAEGLGQAGATVAILDNSEELEDAASRLSVTIGREVGAIKCDLLDRDQTEQLFEGHADQVGGRIDILVNSAGMLQSVPALDHKLSAIEKLFDLNVLSTYQLACLAARRMISNGGGSIINLASIRSFVGSPGSAMYSSTKGAVGQMTKSLSNEWAKYGVRVNALAPGYMDTKLTTSFTSDPQTFAAIVSRIPAGRWGRPEDLKGLSVFLASDASLYVTGTIIPCDGGFLAF